MTRPAYRDSLAIRARLAAADCSNGQWQRELSISNDKVGNVLVAQGKLARAQGLPRQPRHPACACGGQSGQCAMAGRTAIHNRTDRVHGTSVRPGRDFAKAIAVADKVIALAPEELWLYTNGAHALMFVGRIEEARALYLKYRGMKNVEGGRSWETVIFEDFVERRRAR